MDTLLYIDEYFTGKPSEDLKKEFEKKILEDPAFAEEVADYLSAKQIAAEQSLNERKERFKEVYAGYKKTNKLTQPVGLVRKLWPYIAAAAVLAAIIIGWVVFSGSESPEQLADKYLQDNFTTLSVMMGSTEDSLQKGKRLYNEGQTAEALAQFEKIIADDTSSFTAKKFAGIACLKLGQYDRAINYFDALEKYNLHSNPAVFYKALTLLKRNNSGDKIKARQLMLQVVDNNMEGKSDAQQWLKHW